MQSVSHSRISVCVIIPTYNRAVFLRQAIDSALCQTRLPEEVIVVDDGSTDETPQLLAQYGSPVRVLRQVNQGRSVARNAGLRAAASEAVIFLDSDDVLMPSCLERCAQTLETNHDVDVVYSDAYVMNDVGHIVARYSQVLRGRRPSGNVFAELARRCFITVTSMVRRAALTGIEFENAMEQCEDYDLWRRLAARSRFQYLDEPLLAYRFHAGMTVASQDRQTQESALEVQRRFMQMPEFAALPRRSRARFFCAHGVKNALLERHDVAKEFFSRAISACPADPAGPCLLAMSVLGPNLLRRVILTRRRLAGHRFGSDGGPLAVVRSDDRSRHDASRLSTQVAPHTRFAQ